MKARIVRRYGKNSVPEESALHNDLATHARGDPVVAVCVAATEALDGLWGPQTEELLREIASGDPDQLVRFTAQRLLSGAFRSRGARGWVSVVRHA